MCSALPLKGSTHTNQDHLEDYFLSAHLSGVDYLFFLTFQSRIKTHSRFLSYFTPFTHFLSFPLFEVGATLIVRLLVAILHVGVTRIHNYSSDWQVNIALIL